MPNLKKIITRFPELFTNTQFRKDVLGRVINSARAQRNRAKKYTQRLFSKADRYTYKTLDRVDKLIADHSYKEADELLVNSIALYPGSDRPVTQKTLYAWLVFSDKRELVSIQERIHRKKEFQSKIDNYKTKVLERPMDHPRIAVVSAISGGYDTPKPPAQLDSRFDYYLFTDTPVHDMGIFKIMPLPYIDGDQTRSARFVKTNVHRLLPDYDFVVWIDANIMIQDDIYTFVEKVLLNKTDIGVIRHPLRNSVYEEGEACIEHGRGNIQAIKKQLEYYRSINYASTELFETNVIVYNLTHKRTHDFLNTWWNEIDKRSERDQLSVNYSIDKNKVRWSTITDWPNTARNHVSLCLTRHGKHSNDSILLKSLARKMSAKLIDPFELTNYRTIAGENHGTGERTADIIYCVHNALPDVKKCLASIKRHIESNQKLIIIDDGSNESTKKYLEDFYKVHKDWVTLSRSEVPRGYTKAANNGLKLSEADFCVLLNSDTVVTKHWLRKMTQLAFEHKDIGIVGPLSSAASQQSIPDSSNQKNQTATNILPKGITPDGMNRLCEQESRRELMPRVPLVHGFCFGIKREVIESIGYFDEESFPKGYGEENDYCFRAADAGFGLIIATDIYIFHAKSKSYVGPERVVLMDAGTKTLIQKHGQQRLSRSVKTMENNPYLARMRKVATKFYANKSTG